MLTSNLCVVCSGEFETAIKSERGRGGEEWGEGGAELESTTRVPYSNLFTVPAVIFLISLKAPQAHNTAFVAIAGAG